MINLLIFDLDGTLFDSAPGITSAFNRLMTAYGEPHVDKETVTAYIGNGIRDLLIKINSKLLARLGEIDKLEAEFHSYYRECFLKESHLYPGILEFLREWPHQLAIASNKAEFYVRELVAKTELNKFHWNKILGGNSLSVKKPHPQVIYEIINETQSTVQKCLMIGDGLPDMLVAKNANVRSVAVDFGYAPISQLIHCGAHATISHYKELPKVIRAFS
jgi:phosphoglycolate phosphatase